MCAVEYVRIFLPIIKIDLTLSYHFTNKFQSYPFLSTYIKLVSHKLVLKKQSSKLTHH